MKVDIILEIHSSSAFQWYIIHGHWHCECRQDLYIVSEWNRFKLSLVQPCVTLDLKKRGFSFVISFSLSFLFFFLSLSSLAIFGFVCAFYQLKKFWTNLLRKPRNECGRMECSVCEPNLALILHQKFNRFFLHNFSGIRSISKTDAWLWRSILCARVASQSNVVTCLLWR